MRRTFTIAKADFSFLYATLLGRLPPCPSKRMTSPAGCVSSVFTPPALYTDAATQAFYHDKTTVIQEARAFNESPISPRKCRALLTRITYLLYMGETFSTQEATTLFFGVSKLFQHKDVRTR